MPSDELFDPAQYDGYRKQIVPAFDRFYGTLLERIPYAEEDRFEVLDLGAGTGLSANMIASEYPHARIELVDRSAEMIEAAREKLTGERFQFRVEDFEDLVLESNSTDVVVSALALHYLPVPGKRRLFSDVFRALRRGGRFIFGTVVKGPTETLQSTYDSVWQSRAREAGTPESRLREAIERQEHYHLGTLQEHLAWLREAGFNHPDCWFKYYGLGVFSGRV